MLKKSSFHTNSRTKTFAPLIDCIINEALFEMMPDINPALLQFIDIMNLQDLLLHFSHIS